MNKLMNIIKDKKSRDLFFCGAAILLWELILIRWLSSSIRVVAYYSNFVLISAFLGLGIGSIISRFELKLYKYIFYVLFLCVFIGPFLGSFFHTNPLHSQEFVWLGEPQGILSHDSHLNYLAQKFNIILPYQLILITIYLLNTFLFVVFGQYLGDLFKNFTSLKAYTIEIAGSIFGILLFGLLSNLCTPPWVWFLLGICMIFFFFDNKNEQLKLNIIFSIFILIIGLIYGSLHIWSPYYKIAIDPITSLHDYKKNQILEYKNPFGYSLTVNNDYHQMILNLSKDNYQHEFFSSWKKLYDYPYLDKNNDCDEQRILIVGSGTGNDISAAIRNSSVEIDAVEIDPTIITLGKKYHFENPYSNKRVNIINDDARSYFNRTNNKYSKVVFGFLDSHTLISSFSSVRLDNFVYTQDALEEVKKILLPGGKVYLTFGNSPIWLHERFITLLNSVFDVETKCYYEKNNNYANGIIYISQKNNDGNQFVKKINSKTIIPTDDWPYLYMNKPSIPNHYRLFLIILLISGLFSLFLLPKGQRKIKLPYFFMGAAFFLIETSNVISLSLLYGSTWIVNITVFTGILLLIFLGNLTCFYMKKPFLKTIFLLLFLNVILSYLVTPKLLLTISSTILQGFFATVIFLGPIYFASLIFGNLIKNENDLFQIYGSNLLGAVVGGALEYLSLIYGCKFLLVITFVLYFIAFLFLLNIPTKNFIKNEII